MPVQNFFDLAMQLQILEKGTWKLKEQWYWPETATKLSTNAYIQFKADETDSEIANLTLEGEASDSAEIFTKITDNISERPRTTEAISWDPSAWDSRGAAG